MQIYNYLHNYQNWVTYFRLPNLGNAVVWECGLPAAYLSQKLKHRSLSTVLSRHIGEGFCSFLYHFLQS